MALIRMCVVPNCSQRLSRPILWIVDVCATYWTHSTAVCLLMVGLTAFGFPPTSPTPSHPRHPLPPQPPPYTPATSSHPATPLPPSHPLIHAICDITVTVKKVAQKPAVLSS